MKRFLTVVLIVVLTLSVIFTLSACAFINPNNPTSPGTPDDSDNPTEPNKPIEPNEPVISDKPTEPDKPTTPDKPSKPNVPDDTYDPVEQPVGKNSRLDRSNELAQNVDKVPSASSLYNGREQNLTSVNTAKLNAQENSADDYVDLSNPDENAHYQEYLQANRLQSGYEYVTVNNADQYIELLKGIKEIVRNNIKQLDTWVVYSVSFEEERYRLSYDSLADTTFIEYAYTSNLSKGYTCIKSTYNAQGKAVIQSSSIEWVSAEVGSAVSVRTKHVHFVEDDEWIVLDLNDDDPSYRTICACNLKTPSKEFVLLPYGEQSNSVYFKSLDPFTQVFVSKGEQEITYLATLFNGNNENVGQWQISDFGDRYDHFYIGLDIYELAGWDKFAYENGLYYLTVNGEKIVEDRNMFSPSGHEENLIDCGNYQYDICLKCDKDQIYCPQLCFTIKEMADTVIPSEAIVSTLKSIGLGFKDEKVFQQFETIETCSQMLSQYQVCDYSGEDYITIRPFAALVEKYATQIYTVEQMNAFLAEPAIAADEQVTDDSELNIYDFDADKNVDVTEGNIDLSQIEFDVSGDLILDTKLKYKVRLIAQSNFRTVVIAEVSAQFDGNGFSFESFGQVDYASLGEKLNCDDYILRMYVMVDYDGIFDRISNYFDLVWKNDSVEFSTEQFSIVITGNSHFVKVSKEEKSSVDGQQPDKVEQR